MGREKTKEKGERAEAEPWMQSKIELRGGGGRESGKMVEFFHVGYQKLDPKFVGTEPKLLFGSVG